MTSIESALSSVSYAAVCLHSEELGCDIHTVSIFNRAAIEGKLEILIWSGDSGYELGTMLLVMKVRTCLTITIIEPINPLLLPF